MEGFADLTDAFSEVSVPSFPDGDLDFENISFDEKSEEDRTENTTADGALLQEAAAETAASLDEAAEDSSHSAESDYEEQNDDGSDEEDCNGAILTSETPEDDYTSSDGESEQEGCVSGEREAGDVGSAEEAGELLMPVHCTDVLYHGDKEDSIFTEGRPLALEGADNPQDSNEVEGEAESDEELAYFGGVPERGSDMMMEGAVTDEDEQESEEDSSDSSSEGMTVEQEETENIRRDDPEIDGSEFPSIPAQNLQDLIAEVDGEEYGEKMTDFSGEEHQEAGECFAEYPSDLSSFEYAEEGGNNQENKSDASTCMKQDARLENALTETARMDDAEDTDDEKESGFLYSKASQMDADEMMSLHAAAGEQDEGKSERLLPARVLNKGDGTGESSSSSDDEEQEKRSSEKLLDNLDMQELEWAKQLEETQLHGGSRSRSDEHPVTNASDLFNWDFDVLKTDSFLSDYLSTTEDSAKEETPPSDGKQCPAGDVSSYTNVQREDTKMARPSNQGSLDDGFFFNPEPESSEASELGQLGDDEYEEERNWELEQERIKAFYRFYDSDEENGKEGRQIKVQFCANPLSQVIHYETDSSSTDSLSSSTDREEDLSYAGTSDELRESEDDLQIKPPADPPNVQLPDSTISDHSNTQICTGTHKGVGLLKFIMKMGVVMVMGLLMCWLTTDQMDWLRQYFFF